MKHFFTSVSRIFLNCFSKRNLPWHFLAIALTDLLVIANYDWLYFLNVRNGALNYFFFPAIILGAFLPIIIPIALIIFGLSRNKKIVENYGWVLGQAVILASVISSLYKTLTGRIQPNLNNLAIDISHNFQFGFLRHGIFWGWPSSHTTVAFAMAFTIMSFYPKNKTIKFLCLLYAFYIGIGVSLSIHWFSDFVAGAIIGSIIGISVAKYYKNRIFSK